MSMKYNAKFFGKIRQKMLLANKDSGVYNEEEKTNCSDLWCSLCYVYSAYLCLQVLLALATFFQFSCFTPKCPHLKELLSPAG